MLSLNAQSSSEPSAHPNESRCLLCLRLEPQGIEALLHQLYSSAQRRQRHPHRPSTETLNGDFVPHTSEGHRMVSCGPLSTQNNVNIRVNNLGSGEIERRFNKFFAICFIEGTGVDLLEYTFEI